MVRVVTALSPSMAAAVEALHALGYASAGNPTSPNTLRIAKAVHDAALEAHHVELRRALAPVFDMIGPDDPIRRALVPTWVLVAGEVDG